MPLVQKGQKRPSSNASPQKGINKWNQMLAEQRQLPFIFAPTNIKQINHLQGCFCRRERRGRSRICDLRPAASAESSVHFKERKLSVKSCLSVDPKEN